MDAYKLKLINRICDELELQLSVAIKISLDKDIAVDELSHEQANLVHKYLMEEQNAKRSVMQRKIIHLLCLFGMTMPNGSPNMNRIRSFVKGIGSRNPKKLDLYSIPYKLLPGIITQIEMMVNKEMSKS